MPLRLRIPINEKLSLKDLMRRSTYEGVEVEIQNGKAYAIIEVKIR